MFGWFVSAFAGTLAYPLDTVRRVLMQDTNAGIKLYNGIIDCFGQLYEQGGIARFWKGKLPMVNQNFLGYK